MVTSNRDIHQTPLSEKMFIISPYRPNNDGVMTPDVPDVCIQSDNVPCIISFNHLRHRKAGIPFALFVFRCKTHGIGFTIYPPGFTPYARKPLVPFSADGKLLLEKTDSDFFEGTYFDAAMDASRGNVWPKESNIDSLDPRYQTQARHLRRTAYILGIEPGINHQICEQISQILMVPGQLLHECTISFLNATNCQSKGQAIYDVLKQIPRIDSLFERLAEAGACVGVIPIPLFWHEDLKLLQPSRFRTIRIRGKPM